MEKDVMMYDGSSGLLLSFFAPHFPDAKAAGFPTLFGFDIKGHEISKEEWKRKDVQVGGGLVLLDTNANLGEIKPVAFAEDRSKLAYIYLVLLLILITGWLIRRNKI
ncbi:hypothetical protein [Pyrococcus yayanosii]|uniref:Uncharacterized protein n=1 Tax=Pyrococcus yayanosii (strain CH1 / JCM 16557) TaxID=529709 RepID=F8AGE9_PYRYC|nr:hypothetical protein [Pyrococcus yayanosii]AEH25145.1 hypothetical protein PYCH_14750 [Pyrococcus yayanosii CH1]